MGNVSKLWRVEGTRGRQQTLSSVGHTPALSVPVHCSRLCLITGGLKQFLKCTTDRWTAWCWHAFPSLIFKNIPLSNFYPSANDRGLLPKGLQIKILDSFVLFCLHNRGIWKKGRITYRCRWSPGMKVWIQCIFNQHAHEMCVCVCVRRERISW